MYTDNIKNKSTYSERHLFRINFKKSLLELKDKFIGIKFNSYEVPKMFSLVKPPRKDVVEQIEKAMIETKDSQKDLDVKEAIKEFCDDLFELTKEKAKKDNQISNIVPIDFGDSITKVDSNDNNLYSESGMEKGISLVKADKHHKASSVQDNAA